MLVRRCDRRIYGNMASVDEPFPRPRLELCGPERKHLAYWSTSDLYAFSVVRLARGPLGNQFQARSVRRSARKKKVPRGKIVAKKKKCGAHLQSRLKTYHDGVGQVAVGLRLQPHGVELG